ncbi:MAG: 4Fe-4S binding protein [Coprococcus sp.]
MKKKTFPILFFNEEECCGCSACSAICPNRAIFMVENDRGSNIQR